MGDKEKKSKAETPSVNDLPRSRPNIVPAILDKTLVNINVLAKVEVGDRLDRDYAGYFVIQKPSWWTTALRTIRGADRAQALDHITALVETAEVLDEHGDRVVRAMVRGALMDATKGLRNLKDTYSDDATFTARVTVLIDRVKRCCNVRIENEHLYH